MSDSSTLRLHQQGCKETRTEGGAIAPPEGQQAEG